MGRKGGKVEIPTNSGPEKWPCKQGTLPSLQCRWELLLQPKWAKYRDSPHPSTFPVHNMHLTCSSIPFLPFPNFSQFFQMHSQSLQPRFPHLPQQRPHMEDGPPISQEPQNGFGWLWYRWKAMSKASWLEWWEKVVGCSIRTDTLIIIHFIAFDIVFYCFDLCFLSIFFLAFLRRHRGAFLFILSAVRFLTYSAVLYTLHSLMFTMRHLWCTEDKSLNFT